MPFRLSQLPWLPPAPDEFRMLSRDLAQGRDDGARIRHLASHRLDNAQLFRLAATIRAMAASTGNFRQLTRFRLGFLSHGTTELIAPVLVASAARYGILLEVIEAPFDQIVHEALTADSKTNRARPDAVLLALDYRGLPLTPCPADGANAEAQIAAALDHIAALCRGIRKASGATCIVQNLVPPPLGCFGNIEARIPGTTRHLIDEINRRLGIMLAEAGDILFDTAALAGAVGIDAWHDPTQWNFGRFPFAQEFVPIYGDWLARLLGALRGKSRKCLVLDLDNTVWGGVIGDDGLAGIVLGNGNPTGEAFLDVQRMALALRERGIVLAVSSKNDDAVAREPFRRHPEMLLKESHIAVFQANWNDKASNLRAIADALDLGIDALVLLDDNPAERAQVRQELPEVAVPELDDDPAFYARAVQAAGYFETVAFSAEDRSRAEQYAANARRAALQGAASDLDGYLRSLEMTAVFAPFDAVGRPRITQLINKTNQFNLTTRRYLEAQVRELEADPACFTLQVRLKDRFGDNGMISVVVCRPSGSNWEIDTWLMSCRVLNRRLEEAMLNHLVAAARAGGAAALIGRYIPTGRNSLVADHYEKLGFSQAGEDGDGRLWRLEFAAYEPRAVPMSVEIRMPPRA